MSLDPLLLKAILAEASAGAALKSVLQDAASLVESERFAKSQQILMSYQFNITQITGSLPPCPFCFERFGNEACPHWIWTFAGPVFHSRRNRG